MPRKGRTNTINRDTQGVGLLSFGRPEPVQNCAESLLRVFACTIIFRSRETPRIKSLSRTLTVGTPGRGLAKIIAVKTMAIQLRIAPGTCLIFGSLCFESNELGELVRREFKEDASEHQDSNSITTSVVSDGSVSEAGYKSDYGTTSVGSGTSSFESCSGLQAREWVDPDYYIYPPTNQIQTESDSTSSTDQYREVLMIGSGSSGKGGPSTPPEGAETTLAELTA